MLRGRAQGRAISAGGEVPEERRRSLGWAARQRVASGVEFPCKAWFDPFLRVAFRHEVGVPKNVLVVRGEG